MNKETFDQIRRSDTLFIAKGQKDNKVFWLVKYQAIVKNKYAWIERKFTDYADAATLIEDLIA